MMNGLTGHRLQQFLETCIKQPSLMLLSDKLQLLLGRVQPTRQVGLFGRASFDLVFTPSATLVWLSASWKCINL